MGFVDGAGEQQDVGQGTIVTDDDVNAFRHIVAWTFDSMGTPQKAIAEVLGVSGMTVSRMLSNVPEEHRRHLADLSLNSLYESFRNRKGMIFRSMFHKITCYKKTSQQQNFEKISPFGKSKTGDGLRSRGLPDNRQIYDPTAPRAGKYWEACPKKVGLPPNRLKDSTHRPHGGKIEFQIRGLDGEYRGLTAEGMRRFIIVHLRDKGILTWRQIGALVGRCHTSPMRMYAELPDDKRSSLLKSEVDSIYHIDKKGKRTCLTRRINQGSAWERTAARTKGRRGGAKPGFRTL
jgi:hypothetical protein